MARCKLPLGVSGPLALRYHALWFPEHRMERMWLNVTPMEYILIPIRLQL